MIWRFPLRLGAFIAFALASLVATPLIANAQDARLGEVIITAPKAIKGPSETGAPTEWVSITRKVSFSDLDLKTADGSIELERRVSDAAREACERLDALYPVGAPNVRECVNAAVSEAQSQIYFAKALARHQ